jgi:hypothetical protein
MNVRHIGDIAVTSSMFLYKLSIREGGTFKRLRRRHVMNARHIGDIAVTSSMFLYKLSIREGGT